MDHHLERMERIRCHPPAEAAVKQIMGAMAGAVIAPDVRQYAWENGFYVLELTCDKVELIPPPEGFVPKKW